MLTKDYVAVAVVVGPSALPEEQARLVQAVGVVEVRPGAVVDLVEEAAVQITKPQVMVGLAVVVAAQLVVVGD
jgi:hypothetical protein